MGESSVVLFFMITGFLFFSKLMNARPEGLDWTRLFMSRVMRLGPLYLFAMVLMFVIVALLSKGTVRESTPLLAKHAIEWLAFTVVGGPDLNGVAGTPIITAGVTWSLQYEWAFYCALPIIALCLRLVPPRWFLVLGLFAVVAFAYWNPIGDKWLGFMGGISASYVSRWPISRQVASRTASSLVVIGCVAVAVGLYPTAYEIWPLVLLSIAFALIASGNNLFGVFIHPVSLTLGQMAYSIYLLHGIMLFVLFRFLVGWDASRLLTPTQHWMLVVGATPILVAVCYGTFRLIEHPAMRSTDSILRWFRTSATPLETFVHPETRRIG